ncbi:hypothetical protein CesoFtcFv8_018416 [Champsocephalus esox]|uniref:Uncharacterized protein n=2 Tax=Champsocephalus TaxID=52236 RepID=A0AAN8CZR6_CHAGU|nr:hypothetical protein CesoFtcFv8_018416 [Champsocephalus esox]KAK5913685.1 hypothetical protein CgunFtcFv8_008195 [Champsocephalus gunnari]
MARSTLLNKCVEGSGAMVWGHSVTVSEGAPADKSLGARSDCRVHLAWQLHAVQGQTGKGFLLSCDPN